MSKFLGIFQNDDEAFPKRSIMEAIIRWLDLDEMNLRNGSASSSDSSSDVLMKVWDFVFKVLNLAASNFDWEVKLKGIFCWQKVLALNCSETEMKNDEDIVAERKQNIRTVCERRGSLIMVESINDCDQLVRVAAFKTLESIHDHLNQFTISTNRKDLTSCYEIEDREDFDFSSSDEFLRFLGRIDFKKLARSIQLADDDVVNNPSSLLNDIIAAAKDHDDNLLDCY